MINSKSVSTPIEKGAITTDDSVSLSTDVPYCEVVGSLMFQAIVTRPNIAYAVECFPRFCINLNRCTGP
ncbi:hypothetical protein TNCT_686761 [Trichonephila clavata]|uniref:Uncharacterized protein n=1 Tax=Trichonephila clavata TaxID=2740835 RepID=A0A8X6LXD5_TRICU|nr:hypothetical protein TNCT_686761 [Trichonephila clavata]